MGEKVLIKTARDELSPKVNLLLAPSNGHTRDFMHDEINGSRALYALKGSPLSVRVQVSAVSAVVNWGTSPKPFIFRNYNHSPGRLSRYAGGSGYQMWQAVRASSAAPGYFQEFPLHSDIHQVGGLARTLHFQSLILVESAVFLSQRHPWIFLGWGDHP